MSETMLPNKCFFHDQRRTINFFEWERAGGGGWGEAISGTRNFFSPLSQTQLDSR